MNTEKIEFVINIHDIADHGDNVATAVAAAVRREGEIFVVDSGTMDGQTFATSGPGNGYSQTLGTCDYAIAGVRREMECTGCRPSEAIGIDPADGQIVRGKDDFNAGEWIGEVEWEKTSRVDILVPDESESLNYPESLAKMAEAMVQYHHDRSDTDGWKSLISRIRKAAKAVADLDMDELTAD